MAEYSCHTFKIVSPKTTCALMCLGDWSVLGLVKNSDVTTITGPPDVDRDGEDDMVLEDGWNAIVL